MNHPITHVVTPAPRSYLFVPGNRPERFDKALAAGADAVILDLEDAVAPDAKDTARESVARWLSSEHPVVLRINAAGTPWFEDDLRLCAAAGVSAVMLPKAEHAANLQRVAAAAPGCALLPLIESALGIQHVDALAAVDGVQRLVFGSIDLQLDLDMRGGAEELMYFRSRLVLASRVAGLATPVDGVSTTFDDPAEVMADTAHARRHGFGAKLCIHPKQVVPVNAGFSPSDEELAWAQRVVAADAASNGAAVALDGKMVDRPVVARAQRMLRDAQMRAGR